MDEMTNAQPKAERLGIYMSVLGALGMAALGIGFYYFTESEAILLDGLFSLIGFVMGLVTLKVSRMVARPDDFTFPFGYASFEPLLNVSKGLIMGFLALFAFYSAVDSILEGGRPISMGGAVVYALIATGGCLAIALVQRVIYKRTNSPILGTDVKNWFMDGAMSGAVALAFLAASFMQEGALSQYLPYVDPVVVILLVLISLPIPYGITKVSLAELLIAAPEKAVSEKLAQRLDPALDDPEILEYYPRLTKVGRFSYLHLYLLVKPGARWQTVAEQDCFRYELNAKLQGAADRLSVDVIFTEERRWASGTVLSNPAKVRVSNAPPAKRS
jgi:cation diffusion facilitator family transporter